MIPLGTAISVCVWFVLVGFILWLLYRLLRLPYSSDASFFARVVLGHRGVKHPSFDMEENTMDAFHHAFVHSDGIEFDVNLTRDRQLAIIHDSNSLFRVFEPRHVGEKDSKIGSYSLDEAKQLTYRKGDPSQSIPTLDEVIGCVRSHPRKEHLKLMIEVKVWGFGDGLWVASKISELFDSNEFLYDHAVVGSFSPVFLYLCKAVNSRIVTNLLTTKGLFAENFFTHRDWPDVDSINSLRKQTNREIPRSVSYFLTRYIVVPLLDWAYNLTRFSLLPAFLGVGVVGVECKEMTEGVRRAIVGRGFVPFCWGVNSREDMERLLSLKVACCTDWVFSEEPLQVVDVEDEDEDGDVNVGMMENEEEGEGRRSSGSG